MSVIFTTLVGIGAGMLKSIISNGMENSMRKHEMLMQVKGIEIEDRKRAGRLKGVSFTRRFIAISFTTSLVIAPTIYAFMFPEANITIPVKGHENSLLSMFMPWTESKEVIEYIQVPAMIYVWQLLEMFFLIIGFYFGSGGSRVR